MDKSSFNNLPPDFIEILDKIIPFEYKQEVFQAFCTKRPTTFRTNTLKITTPELITKLDQAEIQFKEVGWLPEAFTLLSPYKEFIETYIYKNGLVYVQSLSSMVPALILDPKQGKRVCDLTAAPGSKTSQMAAMMENIGEILANDLSRVRLYKLEHNLKLLGVKNTKTFHRPGQLLWQDYPEYFDKTLLDSPCSLEGTFCTLEPKSYANWSLKKVKILSQAQKFLLRSAISLTKVGGIIVYSTCSLSPEENEEVLDWILTREAGNIELEQIKLQGDFLTSPGILKWNNKSFNPEVTKALRILPSNLMEGFFIAKIKKLRSNL